MRARAVIYGLAAGLLFGLATPVSKLLLSSLDPYTLAGLLYLGAAIASAPQAFARRATDFDIRALRKNWLKLVGIVAFGGVLGPLLLLAGLSHSASASVSIWLNLELVATAALGAIFFKEHLTVTGAIGVGLTVLSGVVVSLGEDAAGLGAGVFIALACVSWGIDNHLTAIVDGVSSKATTFLKGLIGGAFNLALGVVLLGRADHAWLDVAAALALGMASYGISISLYIASSQALGATRGQILFSVSPFWGIAGAAILLSEAITGRIVASFLLLAAGIALSAIKGHGHAHRHEATRHIHLHDHLDGHHTHVHEGEPARSAHSHMHAHEALEHEHDHFPDLHHRHDHGPAGRE